MSHAETLFAGSERARDRRDRRRLIRAGGGATAVKWAQRWRRTGSVAAKPVGDYFRSPLDAHADVLLGVLAERPDVTVEEIRGELRRRGIRAGHGSVWRFFDRRGISFKKNRARRRTRQTGRGGGTRRLEGRPSLA